MKQFLTLMLVMASVPAFGSTSMPDGNYSGGGQWKDENGKAGTYEVSTTISSNQVRSRYKFDGETRDFEFFADIGENGHFQVLIGGHEVGKGYCMSVQCHYELTFGETTLEETVTFWQGKLYRLGSKNVDGEKIIWEESLSKEGN